ncbi:hypothetical protein CEY16_10445 [Halalkalibacillus sediminis]|uniref:Diguanylate cyclase n=1 Tax=Halalkalibacillus sediminis TaxID=2018042 RepID=A0A2I0QS64_9BACI|nr:sensor domain-containing diguanylate cyclase [Halalkalibacillus sediminis]PKR77154.1 hypothetical protein CEY16_10445 [Halalkalibacillus sediminis]
MGQQTELNVVLKEQSKMIEMIALGTYSLQDILEHLTNTVDYVIPDIQSSILLFDEENEILGMGIGPSLPQDFLDTVDGLKPGPKAGSCGTAAFHRQKVVVEDTSSDPLWEDFREIAEKYHLSSCSSIPIISSKNKLLGTMAFYSKNKNVKLDQEFEILETFANLAKLIIERKQEENQLRLSNTVIENSPVVVVRWKVDKNWPVEYISNNIVQFGYSPKEFLEDQINYASILHPIDLGRVQKEVNEHIQNRETNYQQEYRIFTKDGDIRWIDDRTVLVWDQNGNLTHIEGVLLDISDRKEAEERAHYLANNDPLTGLPNRRYLQTVLDQEITSTNSKGKKLALLYLDCDNFKKINDQLGHSAGDEFLIYLAKRLKNCIRETDVIARIGGDEFTVILRNVEEESDILCVINRILETTSEPWKLQGEVFHVTMSVGIAVYPDDGEDTETLIRKADIALYKAKDDGKNTFQWYEHKKEEAR